MRSERALRRQLERDLGYPLTEDIWARLKARRGSAVHVAEVLKEDAQWDKDDDLSPYGSLFDRARDLRATFDAGRHARRRARDGGASHQTMAGWMSPEEVQYFAALDAYRQAKGLPLPKPLPTGATCQMWIAPDDVHVGIVTITVPVWLKWETVRRIFGYARKAAGIPASIPRIGARAQALALDKIKSKPGLSFQRQMEEWNRLHPQWRYHDRAHFRRDLLRAEANFLPGSPANSFTVTMPIGPVSGGGNRKRKG